MRVGNFDREVTSWRHASTKCSGKNFIKIV